MRTILIFFSVLSTIISGLGVIVEQQSAKHFPYFWYNNVKDRIESICFPIELHVENKTDMETVILSVRHHGISGYGIFKRYSWREVLLYEVRGDTLICETSQQGIEYIYPKTMRYYEVEAEYLIYDDTIFQRLFNPIMETMKMNNEKKKQVDPVNFSFTQNKYLRYMLSKDSLRIELAHDKSSQWIYFPIDVDKVIPLKNNH